MEIRILKGEIEAVAGDMVEESPAAAVILQANSAPLAVSRDLVVKPEQNKVVVAAFVPACIAGVTSQMDKEKFEALSQCYLKSFRVASSAGCKKIFVQAFGKGLYWKPIRSAQAARKALEMFASESPDSLVIFAVPEKAYEDWDDIMRF